MNQVSLVVPLNQVSLDGSPETQNHHRRAWATQQCLPSSPIIPASTGPQLRPGHGSKRHVATLCGRQH